MLRPIVLPVLVFAATAAAASARSWAQSPGDGYGSPPESAPWGYAFPADAYAPPPAAPVWTPPPGESNWAPPPAERNWAPPPVDPHWAPPAAAYSAGAPASTGPQFPGPPPAGGGPPVDGFGAVTISEATNLAQLPTLGPADPTLATAGEPLPTPAPVTEPIPFFEPTATPEPGYTWFSTAYWFPPDVWDGSVEIGVNGSAGNAESLNTRAGAKLSRASDASKTATSLVYNRNTNNGVESAHNALFDAQHDWLLGDSPWSLFVRVGLEYDEFRAFDLRLVVHEGIGYRWLDNPVSQLTTRLGAGASREFGGPDDSWTPEGVVTIDYTRNITERQKLAAKVEYLPSFESFSNYRVVSDVSWSVLLDEASNLHLKVSAIDRYDSTPNGRKPNDIDYALLLMWQL